MHILNTMRHTVQSFLLVNAANELAWTFGNFYIFMQISWLHEFKMEWWDLVTFCSAVVDPNFLN